MARQDTMAQMVAAVKQHALNFYEEGAWDTVVECYEDAEIATIIEDANATTRLAAVCAVEEEIKHYAAYRADIQATAF